MKKILLIILLFFTGFAINHADDKVSGEYTYRCGLDKSPEEAKRIALERAKIEALAEKYGTTISQTNLTNVTTSNGDSKIDFESISSSQVKGEWIETIGEPEFSISIDGDMLSVTAKVSGKAREIKQAGADFLAKMLRSASDSNDVSEYHEGDRMLMSFTSPVRGFLSCYLIGDDGMAYCILPYMNSDASIVTIDKDKDYIFFSSEHSDSPAIVDEYTLTADKDVEHNQVYVIFSTNNFSKARDTSLGEGLPRGLSSSDFQKWLAKQRSSDKQMQIEVKTISIYKK